MEEETAKVEVLPQEYFRADIDGESFEAKDTANIRATVYPSYRTGVITFDFMGEVDQKSEEGEFDRGFNFKVCFYDGPGTYYTGTTKTVSWAYYWYSKGISEFELWENHYAYGNEPGEVVVTNATDKFVEGTFEFEAYNEYRETTINVTGEFGIILQSEEDYNQY